MAKKVLIINNTAGQPLLAGILTGARFWVDVASDSRSGLRQLETRYYDAVVLVENRNPESWQITRKIRRLTGVPLMVISANASPEACARGIDAGADYFLRKSFGPRELVARVNSLLYRASLRRPSARQGIPVGV